MRIVKHTTAPTFAEIHWQFRERIAQLIEAPSQRSMSLDAIVELDELLQSLPLATADYGAAHNRLRSAARYLRAGETGAARYELRLALGNVRQKAR